MGDRIKESEMGRPCSTHWRNSYIRLVGNPEGKILLDGRLILKLNLGK
jgi:hypothetical protein